jgi:dipeptidase
MKTNIVISFIASLIFVGWIATINLIAALFFMFLPVFFLIYNLPSVKQNQTSKTSPNDMGYYWGVTSIFNAATANYYLYNKQAETPSERLQSLVNKIPH